MGDGGGGGSPYFFNDTMGGHQIHVCCSNFSTMLEKIGEYLLMGWSESYISLNCQRYMTFTPPHQRIFIEISIFVGCFLSVYTIYMETDGAVGLVKDGANNHIWGLINDAI